MSTGQSPRSHKRPLPPSATVYHHRRPHTITPDWQDDFYRIDDDGFSWQRVAFYTGLAILAIVILGVVYSYAYTAGQADIIQRQRPYLP